MEVKYAENFRIEKQVIIIRGWSLLILKQHWVVEVIHQRNPCI